jgi:hypothetical protein
MGSNLAEEEMLRNTLDAFRGNGQEAANVSPAQGVLLIAGWLQALQGDPNIEPIKVQLGELETALGADSLNEEYIRSLLVSLADKTQAVAEDTYSEGTWTGGLESLSKFLRNFGSKS